MNQRRPAGQGRHTTAAICLHGHVVTADVERFAGAVTKFCSKCGAEVITKCPSCSAPIHGHFVPAGVPGVGGVLRTPAHCHECGKPYPWTAEKIAAAKDLADELEDLTADDLAKLKVALDEIAVSGPKAEVGAVRIKKMLGKASTAVGKALWKMSIDIASEAAKKVLLGQ
jgi:hypothetical protein